MAEGWDERNLLNKEVVASVPQEFRGRAIGYTNPPMYCIEQENGERVMVPASWVQESTETVLGLSDADTTEEKIGKLLALIPMAFEVLNEAQDTIARLKANE